MSVSQIQNDLDTLNQTAAECMARPATAATRARFSQALTHLTASLRTLRAAHSSEIGSFLRHALPPVIDVLRAALSTCDSNGEISRQAVVFLGLLFGIPNEYYTSERQWNAAMHSVPGCFLEMAAKGRKEDVRALLNALLLVASGEREANTSPSRWLLVKRLFGSRLSAEADHFVLALRAILTGWSRCEDAQGSWTPAQYLDVAEAVSIALSIRKDHAHDSAAWQTLVSSVQHAVTIVQSATLREQESLGLIVLAAASGVLRVLDGAGEDYNATVDVELIPLVKTVVSNNDRLLRGFAGRTSLQKFSRDSSAAISITLLLSTISRVVVRILSALQLSSFRKAVELLMQLGGKEDKEGEHQAAASEFHHQVHWCVNNYSVTLGSAYANLIQQERAMKSCIRFLTTFVSENSANAAASRFALATAMKCDCDPQYAVAFVDVLSLVEKQSTAFFEAASQRLAPNVAKGAEAVSTLLHLIWAILNDPVTPRGSERAAFLLNVLSRVLVSMVPATKKADVQARHERVSGIAEGLWTCVSDRVERALRSGVRDERLTNACIACLSRMVETEDVSLAPTRDRLVLSLPQLLLEHYLFENRPASRQKRLLQVVRVLDAISRNVVDQETFRNYMRTIIESASRIGDIGDRIVGILLLRCMTRCNPEVVGVALESISEFVGPNNNRKAKFLPLARAAVLGTDVARKNKCLAWILDFFGNLSDATLGTESLLVQSTSIPSSKL